MKGLKFKTPDKDSQELTNFYDMVFSPHPFFASWCGRIGHYPFDREGYCASNQDGYIYLYLHFTDGFYQNWKMTADSQYAKSICSEYVEINL